MSIGTNVKMRREAQGLTPTALAKVAGISRSYLHDLENQDGMPSASILYRVAAALGCRMEDLMGKDYLWGEGEVRDTKNVKLRRKLARIAAVLADVEE
jgi:transcriptional regulator with XRE-family HTH domain